MVYSPLTTERTTWPAKFDGTCYVRIPWPARKDLSELVDERLLDAMGNDLGDVEREGELGGVFRRRARLVVVVVQNDRFGTSQPLIDCTTDKS